MLKLEDRVATPIAAPAPLPPVSPRPDRHRFILPLAGLVSVVVIAMAYSLFWAPVVLHRPYWIVPGDIWGTFHTAQFVAWGDIGDVYTSGAGLVTLPGISVAFAPVALIVNHLNLSLSFPFTIPRPTTWLVLGPFQAALGALVLFPLDRLGRVLGAGYRARVVAVALGAVALWPVLAMWGHPEDPLAMAFALWGLTAALEGRWRALGWFFGLALVFQPLVILMLPAVFAIAPARRWMRLAIQSCLPAALLLAIPFAQSWRATTTALFKQPNYPTVDHPTPWIAFAPVLSKTHAEALRNFGHTSISGGAIRFTTSILHTVAGETVAAGPGRMIAIGLAFVIGYYVFRRRPSPEQLVWLCCVALALRCVFEAVMDPYYLWPPIAIAIVLVVRDTWRLTLAVAAGSAMTWWSYRHTGPWTWWLPVVLLLGLIVAAAAPKLSLEPWFASRAKTGTSKGWKNLAVERLSG